MKQKPAAIILAVSVWIPSIKVFHTNGTVTIKVDSSCTYTWLDKNLTSAKSDSTDFWILRILTFPSFEFFDFCEFSNWANSNPGSFWVFFLSAILWRKIFSIFLAGIHGLIFDSAILLVGIDSPLRRQNQYETNLHKLQVKLDHNDYHELESTRSKFQLRWARATVSTRRMH